MPKGVLQYTVLKKKNKNPKSKKPPLSCMSRARLQNSYSGTTLEVAKWKNLRYSTQLFKYNICSSYENNYDSVQTQNNKFGSCVEVQKVRTVLVNLRRHSLGALLIYGNDKALKGTHGSCFLGQ